MENETQTSRLLGEYLTQVVQCISEVQAASTSLQDTEARKSLEEFAAMLLDRAGEIAERLEDRTFTVGIIGEFSCGKSTFLNAFTERRYLVEAIEQGTTCAPTRLVYSPREEVLVQYSNGRTVTMPAGQDMKAFLARVTASEEEGKNITEVRWNTPIPLLRDGLNIIDTPGISSTNPRHTQVAKAVARQCDALIVLTNLLSMPLSKTLIEAVWEIVGKTGRNCLFVGTYCDKLRPREVEKMDGFFRMKLNGSFELPKRPLSLKEGMRRLADAARFLMRFGKNRSEEEAAQEEEPPRRPFYLVSAYKALEELEAEQAGSQGPHAYLQAFREFREEVREKLVTSRQYIQCEKISSLITDLVEAGKTQLKSYRKALQKQSRALEDQMLPQGAWKKWQKKMLSSFEKAASNALSDKSKLVFQIFGKMEEVIQESIVGCENYSELKAYLERELPDYFSRCSMVLQDHVSRNIEPPLLQAATSVREDFLAEMRRRYSKLEEQFGKPARISLSMSSGSSAKLYSTYSLGNEAASLFDASENSFAADVATTLRDALFFLPGSGILADMVEGLFVDLDEKKNDSWAKIQQFMQNSKQNINTELIKVHGKIRNQLLENLLALFESQQEAYTRVIELYNEPLARKVQAMEHVTDVIARQGSILAKVNKKVQAIRDEVAMKTL